MSQRKLAAGNAVLAITLLLGSAPALASPASERIAVLERTLAAQQTQVDALIKRLNDQAVLLHSLTDNTKSSRAEASAQPPGNPPLQPAALITKNGRPDASGVGGLGMAGDVRIREEFNTSDTDGRDRTRTVLRARLRATYKINDHLAVGGQLTTGDPDDPNSADITLVD